nr:MAG TPA: hypothetical protein [Caudoviricetes sp.]
MAVSNTYSHYSFMHGRRGSKYNDNLLSSYYP